MVVDNIGNFGHFFHINCPFVCENIKGTLHDILDHTVVSKTKPAPRYQQETKNAIFALSNRGMDLAKYLSTFPWRRTWRRPRSAKLRVMLSENHIYTPYYNC